MEKFCTSVVTYKRLMTSLTVQMDAAIFVGGHPINTVIIIYIVFPETANITQIFCAKHLVLTN